MGHKRLILLLLALLVLGGLTAYLYRPEPASEYAVAAAPAAAPAPAKKPPTSQELRQRLEESRQKYRQREAQDEDKRLAPEDKTFADWYAQKARWKRVPEFVSEMYLDGSGKSWYTADGSDRLFHQTIENAAAGKTALIRGGRILLVDRQGRFWAMHRGGGNILYCYDGKKWTEERFAVGGAVVASTQPAHVYGRFVDAAFEDSTGNLFFVGGWRDKTGSRYGIHTRKPDGTWNYTLFPPLAPPRAYEHPLENHPLSFMELPGKRVVIYPRFPQREIAAADCRIYYFNGQAWSEKNPTICKDTHHRVEAVVPLADGSICTLCSGERLWTYWPEPKSIEKLETLVVNLGHADAQVRESAASALLAQGPQISDELVKLSDLAAQIPESENRLKVVLETLSIISKQDHSRAGLQGGRFRFDYPYLTSQTRDGGVRLHVSDCFDNRTRKKYKTVYLTISPTGQWNVQEIPEEDWYMAGIEHVPTRGFEDSLGGLWVGEGLRTTPSFSLAPIVPEGFQIDMPAFEDAAHRLYFTQYPRFVLDPSLPQDKGDLPRHPFRGAGLLHLPGEASAWGVNDDDTPHVLFEITAQGEMKSIADNVSNAYTYFMLPLKRGFIVDYYQQYKDKPFEAKPSMWDGSTWYKAETLDELIRSNAARLAPLVGTKFMNQGREATWLAGDGKHFWYYQKGMKPKDPNGEVTRWQEFRRYNFFDGEKWRNVHEELNFSENDNVGMRGAVQGGKSIIVIAGQQARQISFDGNKLVQKEIFTLKTPERPTGPVTMVNPMLKPTGPAVELCIDGPNDEVWFGSMSNKSVYSWKDGQLKEHPYNARPQMCDSKGRMWFTADQSAFVAKVGEQWIKSAPKLIGSFNCMAEGPDGRIWAVHLDGLSELIIDGLGEKAVIREGGRWSLGGPKNSVREIHIDQANGLWFFGGARRIVRYQLPAAVARG